MNSIHGEMIPWRMHLKQCRLEDEQMKEEYYTDEYGNKWKEMDSKLFPDKRVKIMLPQGEEE